MKAGEIRYRVGIQRASGQNDSQGEEIQSWRTLTTRWGAVESLSGAELWKAQQVDPEVTHRVRLRYYEPLTPKHRLTLGARVLGISWIDDVDNRHVEQHVFCTEQVSLGDFYRLLEDTGYRLLEDGGKRLMDNP